MQNKLVDLNNHLFSVIEALTDDDVCHDAESTRRAIDRANAVAAVSREILGVGRLQLDAVKTAHEYRAYDALNLMIDKPKSERMIDAARRDGDR